MVTNKRKSCANTSILMTGQQCVNFHVNECVTGLQIILQYTANILHNIVIVNKNVIVLLLYIIIIVYHKRSVFAT